MWMIKSHSRKRTPLELLSLIASSLGITEKMREFEHFCLRGSLATLLNLLCGKVGYKPHTHDQLAVYGPAQSLCPVEQINMNKRFLDNNACHNLLFCLFPCMCTTPNYCNLSFRVQVLWGDHLCFAVVLYLAQRGFIVNWTSSQQTCKLKGQSMEVTATIQVPDLWNIQVTISSWLLGGER